MEYIIFFGTFSIFVANISKESFKQRAFCKYKINIITAFLKADKQQATPMLSFNWTDIIEKRKQTKL